VVVDDVVVGDTVDVDVVAGAEVVMVVEVGALGVHELRPTVRTTSRILPIIECLHAKG
jgi:hypothetical protein